MAKFNGAFVDYVVMLLTLFFTFFTLVWPYAFIFLGIHLEFAICVRFYTVKLRHIMLFSVVFRSFQGFQVLYG